MIAILPPSPYLTRPVVESLVARYSITMLHIATTDIDAARGVCPGRAHPDADRMIPTALATASDRPVLCLVLPGACAPRKPGRAVVLHVTPSGALR